MSLTEHATAARILADVFAEEFASQTDDHLCCLAGMLSSGYRRAADRMDDIVVGQAQDHAKAAACTIDHAKMGTPACPACGAKRK